MRVDFYEEFPTEENLARLSLVRFPTNVYVAASSLGEFRRLRERLSRHENVRDVGYWPVLSREAGYWLSPFSGEEALEAVLGELEAATEPLTVMWDAELPFLRKRRFLTGLPGFLRRRRRIRDFLRGAAGRGLRIVTSEYCVGRPLVEAILRWLCVRIPAEVCPHRKLLMYYTSMIGPEARRRRVFARVAALLRKGSGQVGVALGTLATGVFGNEPILDASDLERDLADCARLGVDTVTVFRLGGLDEVYGDTLARYAEAGA